MRCDMQQSVKQDDPVVPYNGGLLEAAQPDIDSTFRSSAGCSGTEKPFVTFNSSTTTCTRTECRGVDAATPVESCTVTGLVCRVYAHL